jgi:hypothetical protein
MAGGLTPDRGPETLGGQYVELGAIPYKLHGTSRAQWLCICDRSIDSRDCAMGTAGLEYLGLREP